MRNRNWLLSSSPWSSVPNSFRRSVSASRTSIIPCAGIAICDRCLDRGVVIDTWTTRPTHDSNTHLHNTNNKCRFVECNYLKHAPKCPVNRCVFKSCKNVQSQQLVTHQSVTVLVCYSAIFHHLSMPNKLNSIISFNHFKSLHNSVSQKNPPAVFWYFSQMVGNF